MIVLGIHDGHNATAALLINGEIVAMVSEERFTYRKNEMGFPVHAVRECLKTGRIKGQDVDEVAFSMISLPINYLRVKRECLFTVRDYLNEQEYYWKPKLFENLTNHKYFESLLSDSRFKERQVYSYRGIPIILSNEQNRHYLDRLRKEALRGLFGIEADKVRSYDHHTCHKYYAYFGSPFRDKKTLIFTADGGGDGANGTVSIAQDNLITELARNNCTDLARIYRYITLLLGMKVGEHEYKVMGLAPYASEYEAAKCIKVFKGIFKVRGLLIEYKRRPKDLFFHFRDAMADCRFDGIAAGAQEMVEEIGREWFLKVTKKIGVSRVVFSGGLSMNVKLNKIICELDSVKEFYCPPSGGDESTALGACYIAHMQHSRITPASIENNYLGPRYTKKEILRAISKLKNCKIYENVTNIRIASLLAKNIVVARFCGRAEFGARALGNRSILADPSNPEIIKKINREIKLRDFWMPFAPSILDRDAPKYLINSKNISSDHMTICFDTTKLGRKLLSAALHPVDLTVRAHILKKDINPDYYNLIEAFKHCRGVGALLNTSFNLHGRPMVCTPQQAVSVFNNSDLEAMVLEDVLIVR